MNAAHFADAVEGTILTGGRGADREVRGVYVCDLLSRVMSHASKGDAWITVHTHMNVVAVALLAETACVIIPEGIEAEAATVNKASEEGVVMISTHLTAYEICCRAYEILKA